jgi:hypothetical protein
MLSEQGFPANSGHYFAEKTPYGGRLFRVCGVITFFYC